MDFQTKIGSLSRNFFEDDKASKDLSINKDK